MIAGHLVITDCTAILHRRRGNASALRESDFAALCKKLEEKYGVNPLAGTSGWASSESS